MNEPRWAELGHSAGQFDADLDRSTLELAGIPVMVKGPLTGAFGPGYVGWTPEGVRLYVPDGLLDEARAILHGSHDDGSDTPDDDFSDGDSSSDDDSSDDDSSDDVP
jgi:hypothetical protein